MSTRQEEEAARVRDYNLIVQTRLPDGSFPKDTDIAKATGLRRSRIQQLRMRFSGGGGDIRNYRRGPQRRPGDPGYQPKK